MRSNAVDRIQIGPPDRPRLGSIWLDFSLDDLESKPNPNPRPNPNPAVKMKDMVMRALQ